MSTNHNRVAVVTGGSRGIGRAVAERLAADGLDVVIVFAANEVEAKAAVTAIQEAGGRSHAIQADVADESAVKALFDMTEQLFGGVDVVVNAAGTMVLQPVAELDLDEFDRMHRTNVRGTFVVAREAAGRLRDGGAIVNFSTSVTRLNLPTYAAYAASKAAVEALGPILARELRGRDITVNAVAPGPTATALFLEGKSDEMIRNIAGQNPMERLGRPEDIAEVISLLAGRGRWINGQTIYVNGGAA
ncbi:SDR family oxidoreductase [Micromonospora profundi]|uniref:SDR family oxidoreductase n=1 Tax=Micromonospora profundi TaxID=1420889 RepID=A0AAJ6HRB7_9ACTN|nr:SDR family oxidoreductase [Micromonospora profundi]NJC13084.1 3-oxoacyl-[acyl-carrier protein] reductase [Micromonospora profundi]WLS44822.1 SDR family oxidoreductase [Micromonospora profundi]